MTLVFVDIYGLADNLNFLTRVQFVPALLSLNVVALIFLFILTLLFGRLYCSVICPLGITQDIVAKVRKIFAGKKKRKIGLYGYKKPRSKTRNIVLGCFILVLFLGALNVMAISLGAVIEPYSAFGRMVTAFVSPFYDMVNNAMADASANAGEYEYTVVHRSVSWILFLIAGVTALTIAVFAWRGGRDYCNTICPVGTFLGWISRVSLFKIRIDEGRCNSCGTCARKCKSSCIDSRNHTVDTSRCVECFDCLSVCRQNAIGFSVKPVTKEVSPTKNADSTRRMFIATLATLTGAAVAKSAGTIIEKTTDGGLTPLKKRAEAQRKVRMLPPGAISQAHINAHCVGCQLCIQACPNGVLKMSTDLDTLMQPVMSYETSYCYSECSECSNVCPAGVFQPLDAVAKSSWKIGTAVVDLNTCLSANGTDSCGNCARHCPAGAIEMVATDENNPEAPLIPVIKENICIGCGACEHHCPVGTVASMQADSPAIHVEGVSVQRYI